MSMSVNGARDYLIFAMENLHSMTNNVYYEEGEDLADRIEVDLEDVEYHIEKCREALRDYKEALESEE